MPFGSLSLLASSSSSPTARIAIFVPLLTKMGASAASGISRASARSGFRPRYFTLGLSRLALCAGAHQCLTSWEARAKGLNNNDNNNYLTFRGGMYGYHSLATKATRDWNEMPPIMVSSVEEMQEFDHGATEKYGIPSILLMESAGLASFRHMVSRYNIKKNSRVLIFAGPGNNGGDGFVVARHALAAGADVRVVLLANPEKYKDDARVNYESVLKLGIEVTDALKMDSSESKERISSMIHWADVSVDAIFGVGLARDVGGRFAETISLMNESKRPIFALDIPSGVNGDTGHVMGVAVRADSTITYGVPKLGNMLFPGHQLCGELVSTRISFPPGHDESATATISRPSPNIKDRDPAGHKSTFGQALFVAGSKNYYGAPKLAALSFLKAGGGYSRLACPESIIPAISVTAGTLVYVPMPETGSGAISKDALGNILAATKKQHAVVVGPGLSLNDETRELVLSLLPKLSEKEIPTIIDGDALTFLSESSLTGGKVKKPGFGGNTGWILTPHLGELSRLLGGKPIREIQSSLIESGREAAKKYQATVVVKGAHSLVVSPDGKVSINPTGNSGMGTAGTGDVLTGCIAAMLASGLPPYEASVTGVFLHGMAGDRAASEVGMDGMTADEVMKGVSGAMQWLRDPGQVPDDLWKRYMGPKVV